MEVDFVASLVENGARLIETGWQGILAPDQIQVGVAGIFCHQSPKVRIKGTSPYTQSMNRVCELADLLVLHSHMRHLDQRIFYRGVLMQTKSHSRTVVVADQPQLWLYTHWPKFVITSPGFQGNDRDFNGDSRSGKYSLVSQNGWHVLPGASRMTAPSTGSQDFAEFLVEMLYDMDPAQPNRASLHGRQVYHNSQKDWSQTIWELIRITADIPLSHKGKKFGLYRDVLSRMGGTVVQMLQSQSGQRFHTVPPKDSEAEPDREGMSILIIETVQEGALE
jgi:hypothetical protein